MTESACQLCGRQLPADPVADVFCSTGCRDVEATLASVETDTSEHQTPTSPDGETERTFFHVAGMHTATDETFLESRVCARDGVHSAEASYVTETVSVTYDPAVVAPETLADALSGDGFRVVPREETTGEAVATALSREGDPDTRELEDLLGFRYAAGIVFGTFMLLPYVVVFYPMHLSDLLGVPFLGLDSEGLGSGALLLLPLFAGVTGVVVFFTGLPLLRGAYVSLRTRQPTTDLLAAATVLAAYAYSIVAFLLGRLDSYFDLAIVVAAGVVAATFYESLVKQEAMERLTDLTVSQTDEARYRDGETVPVEALSADDELLVRQGERVPVDGTLVEGSCIVDESVVTGESLPVTKHAGEQLVGGAIVTDGPAVVSVADPPTSSIDRLTTAVWSLQTATHGLQRRADRLAGWVGWPLLALAVAVTAGAFLVTGSPIEAVLGGLTVVLVGSPWGVALSTPLTIAGNLRAAMARGVVVFDETVFERVRETDVVVFDKTGTLTSGEMRVHAADGPEDLLAAAAVLEQYATHPAAEAIRDAFEGTGAGLGEATDVETHSRGVSGTVDGVDHLVGHPTLFADRGWTVSADVHERVAAVREAGRLPVVVGRDGRAEGVVVLADRPRAEWGRVVTDLGEQAIDVVVLTGDDERAAAFFRDHPAVTHTFAGISPQGKTETIRRLQADNRVTMVGDGTNDAPALAQADLGVAVGSGTALASDAADIAIADDDLGVVETVFDLARAARRRVRQNTALALSYNAVVIPATLAGLLNPVVVIAGAVVAACLVAGNAQRDLL